MFTSDQVQRILQGFVDYHAKRGAKTITREVSPRQGYMVDDRFYADETIIRAAELHLELLRKADK